MDGVRSVLGILRDQALVKGRLRGLFHLFIGKNLAFADGTPISTGLTWRQLAAELKMARFDKNLVKEVGADPETLSPRDRERFWYSAIGMADISGETATNQAADLLKSLKAHGVVEVKKKKS